MSRQPELRQGMSIQMCCKRLQLAGSHQQLMAAGSRIVIYVELPKHALAAKEQQEGGATHAQKHTDRDACSGRCNYWPS